MPALASGSNVLNYRIDGGDDDLPLLVLSNGLGLDLGMWEPQMPALAREFRVLRYDTRGHGGSSPAPSAFAIADLGRDVLALLDHLGADRMHFCGFSMGGIIGIWLGIHAPRRLDKLVLAHTAACIGPQAMWNERMAIVSARGMQAISDAAMRRWFTAGFVEDQPGIVGALKTSMERNSPLGYVQCCAAIRDADYRDQVARIHTPTLVVSGVQDVATTPADARFLAQSIAGAQAVEIDSAHLSNFEKPQEFTAALRGFLSATGVSNRIARLASAR
ncbi:MAG: 3-oxoadipate enol-lactonase [Burkholderiales bacterium]|nr:3-oxoadipate enol-lactonase [Burkholderiales bacterium]